MGPMLCSSELVAQHAVLMTPLLVALYPYFSGPLAFLASFLQFIFLYNSGIKQLRRGFASSQSAAKVKPIVTVYVVTSTLQLVPGFIFDTRYHFGALWDFFFPFILFIVPWKNAPEQTLAASLCDTLFSTLSTSVGTLFASIFPDHDGQITVSVVFSNLIRLILSRPCLHLSLWH